MSPARYRNLRRQIGTQKEVAALLCVQQSVISKRERGKAPISREIALAIHQLFERSSPQRRSLPCVLLAPERRSTEKAQERREDAKAVKNGLAKSVQERNSQFLKHDSGPLVIPNLREALGN